MFITTRRQRRIIFITLTILTGVAAYHEEATEVFTAIHEHEEMHAQLHVKMMHNAKLESAASNVLD